MKFTINCTTNERADAILTACYNADKSAAYCHNNTMVDGPGLRAMKSETESGYLVEIISTVYSLPAIREIVGNEFEVVEAGTKEHGSK